MGSGILSTEILQSLSDAMTGLADEVGGSVVRVTAGRSVGSGVVWSEEGHILTCSHVVGRATNVHVGLTRNESVDARVIGLDSHTDIALLKANMDGLKPIHAGDSEKVKVGQLVFAFANPFGQMPSATSGIVTTAKASLGWGRGLMQDMIITDAPLNPGYSGGPLVDATGRMVGLNVAYINSRGVAVPINAAQEIIATLMREGRIRRGRLGIFAEQIGLPKDVVEKTGINQQQGLMVIEVTPDSPAKKAGMLMGDIMVRFNTEPITCQDDLSKMLTKGSIGRTAEIQVLRAETLVKMTATPTEDTA